MTEHPRVTYQSSQRSFDRLFKEQSLDETKDVVRKKLGLGHDAAVELVQLRDGRRIDLEDDDDFEAFKAVTKTSLHATVAVIIPNSSSTPVRENAQVEGRRSPNGSLSEPEAAHFGMVAPATKSPLEQLPSTRVTDTSRPRKKQKVVNLVTFTTPQSSQRPPSPHEGPTSIHKSTSEAVALAVAGPTVLRPASQAENSEVDPSDQVNPAADPAETSRNKRKRRNSGKESSPEHGTPNHDTAISRNTRKKRKDQTAVSVMPTDALQEEVDSFGDTTEARVWKSGKRPPPSPRDEAIPTRMRTGDGERSQALPTTPATGDASLQLGIEVTKPDKSKQAKTRKQKSGPVDAESSVTKSKMGPVDPTEDTTPDLTKSLKRASKKRVDPEVSKVGPDDDIDKTIAAFMTRRLQAGSIAMPDPAAASELAVPFDVPPPKTKRKGVKVKSGAVMNGTIHTITQRTPSNRMESMETSGADTSVIGEVIRRRTESTLNPTPEPYVASVGPRGSQSSSKLGSAKQTPCPACLGSSVHPLADCPVVLGGPDSIVARIVQMEKNPGLAPSSDVLAALPQFAEKARTIPSDSSNDSSDVESSRESVPSVALYEGGSSTEAEPTTVPVEGHGESSNSEGSTKGEIEGDGLTQLMTPVNASPAHLHRLEDQLVPLIHASAKRGPRRSILDEIPSSSETGSKSSSEDLVLDEEEDLSLQPPHRPTRKLPTTRPSSTEPELTSGDEEDSLMPVYMDTSHGDCSPEVPPIGGTWDHVSINAEEASGRLEVDTYLMQPLETGIQDRSISPQTRPNKTDATAPQSQSGTEIFGSASPESDATAINTEAAKSPILASSSEQQAGRVLVPASSSYKGGTVENTETKTQDENDDVESTVEPPGGDEESDPIEPEPTQPPANGSRRSNPSRRSGRLADRQPSTSNSGATLVPLTQVRRKVTSALEKSAQSAKEEGGVIRHGTEEATQERIVRKRVEKSGIKLARSSTQHSRDSEDDTSPSVAREDGSPTSSHVKWATLPPSQPNSSLFIDELRTSSQGSLRKLSQGTSGAEIKTPVLSGRGVTVSSRRGKGSAQPLFFPGSSQVAPRAPSPSPSGSENESETAAPLLPTKTPTKSTPGSSSQFRRLTDLTSSDVLFSKSKAALRRFKNTPSVKVQPRFKAGDDGEDDDGSSSSSEDRVPSSHIPRERRAGASTRRKGRGLSSLGD